jgi:hypothetical protein
MPINVFRHKITCRGEWLFSVDKSESSQHELNNKLTNTLKQQQQIKKRPNHINSQDYNV